MKLGARFRSWLRASLGRGRMESDMDRELRFHLERRAEDLVRGGMSEEEARRQAQAEFGGVEARKDECREALGLRLLDDARRFPLYASHAAAVAGIQHGRDRIAGAGDRREHRDFHAYGSCALEDGSREKPGRTAASFVGCRSQSGDGIYLGPMDAHAQFDRQHVVFLCRSARNAAA